MWTSPSSSNSIPFSSSSSYAILGNDTNSSNSRLPKSMEEIWKDITLSSLHPANHSTRGMILQDFFCKDPPHSAVDASPPPPPTVLTLSSRQEHFNSAPLGYLHPRDQRSHVSNHVSTLVLPFDQGLVPDQSSGCGKNRYFPDLERSSGDRRHKRMIKNRESAARSRARKQENIVLNHLFTPNTSVSCYVNAYTNELELEVAHLLEENARLKKQQQQQSSVAAADTHRYAKKKTLQRTSTAPF